MKKQQNLIPVLLTLLLCLFIVSCQGEMPQDQSLQQNYRMYYVKNQSKLVSESFSTELTVAEDLISEFLEALQENSPNNVEYQSAIPEDTRLVSDNFDTEKKMLTLYFDTGDIERKNKLESILSRAAIVRTLTQISGVDYLYFYVNDQPLVDATGKIVGAMRASDFIEDLGGDVNDYEKTTLTLYFANEAGDKLIEEERELVYAMSSSMARLVIEQLVAGPKTEGLFPVLPSDIKLLNIAVQDGVCYVNLDAGFLTSAVSTIEVLPIYAIVNSLSELPTINKVQIAVNGETNKRYREVVSLDVLFERNLDLVTTLEDEQNAGQTDETTGSETEEGTEETGGQTK